MTTEAMSWMQSQSFDPSFFRGISEERFRVGAKALIQGGGFGPLRANILVIGFKRNWAVNDPQEYYEVVM